MEEDKLSLEEEKGRKVTKEEKELLYSRVEELKRSNAILLEENDMLDKFIVGWSQDCEFQKEGNGSGAAGGPPLEGDGGGWKQKSDHLQLLTMEQKTYLAEKVGVQTQHELEDLKERSERVIDTYMATLEEANLRRADTKRSEDDFECRMQKILNDRLVMHQPENVLKCIEDTFKVIYIKKLNLKNQILDTDKRRLMKELKHKEAEDNQIKEWYREYEPPKMFNTVEELRTMSMTIKHNLFSHREQLHSMTLKSTQLNKDITKMKQRLAKIEEEIQHTEEEHVEAETLNQHLRRQLADYQAPDITEYMHVKAKHKNLLQSVQTWERNVGIAELALKTQTRGCNKQRAPLTPARRVETGPRFGGQVPVKLPDIAEHSRSFTT
ncbi:cilia- and flagella-associated protein 263 isoform X2 [Parambassis ranga]|uniref:Cilia- and flagella-associated protein 263 n=1 Tax=Parambassis ranga TaxID=210632 RepID=A0A6P7ITF0_9TELE|nr:coiled-coil domain-containing protein 113 isoform X2 [Parambassis ranga]